MVLNDRAAAEEELLALSYKSKYRTTVLNLSGLCGGERSMRHVVGRIAPSKEALKMAVSSNFLIGEFPQCLIVTDILTQNRAVSI